MTNQELTILALFGAFIIGMFLAIWFITTIIQPHMEQVMIDSDKQRAADFQQFCMNYCDNLLENVTFDHSQVQFSNHELVYPECWCKDTYQEYEALILFEGGEAA